MVYAANLGFPRIGAQRELKKLVEAYWAGKADARALSEGAAALRARHWELQRAAGVDVIPSNDFSLYDQVLDHIVLFDAIPDQYRAVARAADATRQYFALGRGLQDKQLGVDVPAMEMKKWFDTNYHYIVPRLGPETQFRLAQGDACKPLAEYKEAKALGIETRPVLLGPVSFLQLGRAEKAATAAGFAPLDLLDRLVPLYAALLAKLKEAGAAHVQLDEPALALDVADATRKLLLHKVYAALAAPSAPHITLATYFGAVDHVADALAGLPVHAVHVDLVHNDAREQLPAILAALKKQPEGPKLSLGLVNGRNVWRADLAAALELADAAARELGKDRIFAVAPSCSLLHAPVSLAGEGAKSPLPAEVREWLAFAEEKLHEVVVLKRALNEGTQAVRRELDENRSFIAARRASPHTSNQPVRDRVAALQPEHYRRPAPFADRWAAQAPRLQLPRFPTTTVGSFPQTKEVRAVRAKLKKGEITEAQYWDFVYAETEKCVRFQEEVGLDVLVHGEFERNDMVEYFGEQLQGYVFTANGWVQSYGSRCVKPPIIFGDVVRPRAMTVDVIRRAQEMTTKPLKGMLTGPITMLQWSFVRDDQPRSTTATQLALAIRDEVVDLEAAGIRVIQIDEPAIREGLPLRRKDWEHYLQWAVDAFRLATSGVRNDTQIHSHMCYSDFNDILDSIARMDVDVLSVESAKSDLKLLAAFDNRGYANHLGPGIYDIHSPRVPAVDEMKARVQEILARLPAQNLWINPDCGLKTRGWAEVKDALANLTAVARHFRSTVAEQ